MKIALAILLLALRVSAQTTASTFGYVDVFADPHGKSLAAYQLELRADNACATIVGVEGGAHPAFRDPPFYDPAALAKHRIILAAFSTQHDLPTTRTRIARVHFRFDKSERRFTANLIAAGDSDGKSIPPQLTVSEGVAP